MTDFPLLILSILCIAGGLVLVFGPRIGGDE